LSQSLTYWTVTLESPAHPELYLDKYVKCGVCSDVFAVITLDVLWPMIWFKTC
jgi:hypothetical protein